LSLGHPRCQGIGRCEALPPEIAEGIVRKVSKFAYDGITTAEIYRRVNQLLRREAYPSAARFRLKEAIMRMGPSGFPFETYVGEILKHHGYQTRTRVILKGACVNHEVDIIAEEPPTNTKHIIECKYHNVPGIYTGLKEALYTYARLLDLKEGHKRGLCERLDAAWLVTNTKISREAEVYGRCKGLRVMGWRHPPRKGLEKLIEEKSLYPITILESVDKDSLEKFSKAGLMLVKNLITLKPKTLSEKTNISRIKLTKILADLEKIKPDLNHLDTTPRLRHP